MSAIAVHATGTNHRGAIDEAVAGAVAPRPVRRPIAIPRHARDDPLIGRRLARAPVDGGASPTSVAAVPTCEGGNGQTDANQEPNQAFAKNETKRLPSRTCQNRRTRERPHMATDPARVPPHAAHVPRVLFERIARDPASAGRPHAFTADAAVVAVDICGYVPMTARAMLGVLRRERSVVRPERLRGSFGSSSSSFDRSFEGKPVDVGDERARRSRSPRSSGSSSPGSDGDDRMCHMSVAGLTGEEARNVVSACFASAIEEIHRRGGDVLKFAGDALFAAWFATEERESLGDCVAEATRCALAVHARVAAGDDRPAQTQTTKTELKVCVGAGRLCAFNVGGVGGKWEFVCAGEPLAQIARVMPAATGGGTLVSEEAFSSAFSAKSRRGSSLGRGVRFAAADAERGYRLVTLDPRDDDEEDGDEGDVARRTTGTPTPEAIAARHAPGAPMERAEWTAAVVAACASHVPPPAEGGGAPPSTSDPSRPGGVSDSSLDECQWIGAIRRCSVAFVHFEGVDLNDVDERTGACLGLSSLQRAVVTMQRALRRARGASRQMLVDERGSALVAVFGADAQSFVNAVNQALPSTDPCGADGAGRSIRGVSDTRVSNTCASDATLAAVDIARELRGVGLRVSCGVSTGDAFCGLVGSRDRCEWAVYGDVANVAARLCHHERNAGVLVCDATRRACEEEAGSGRGNVEFIATASPLRIKGKRRVMVAHEPRARDPTTTSVSGTTPSTGGRRLRRTGSLAAELDQLRRRMDAMPAEVRRVARTAAVIGGDVDVELLARVVERTCTSSQPGAWTRRRVDACVRVLTERGVLVEVSGGTEGAGGGCATVRFADELTRKVTYSSLTDAARRPLHGAVAAAREVALGVGPGPVGGIGTIRGGRRGGSRTLDPEDACELVYHWNRAGRVDRADEYLDVETEEEAAAVGEEEALEIGDLSEVTVTLSLDGEKGEEGGGGGGSSRRARKGCFAGLFR